MESSYRKTKTTITPWQTYSKLFEFIFRYKWLYSSAVLAMIVGGGMGKVIPSIYAYVIDNLTENLFQKAVSFAILILVIKLSGDLIRIIGQFINDLVLFKVVPDARIEFIYRLQQMDYKYHTNKSSGSLISVARRGENAIFTLLIEINNFTLDLVVGIIVSIVSSYFINRSLATPLLLMAVFTVSAGLILVKMNVKRRRIANYQDDRISGLTVDNLIGFETVKLFAQEKWERSRFRKVYVDWKKAYFRYGMSFYYIDLAAYLIGSIGLFSTIIIGIHLIQNKLLTIGEFTAVMVYVFYLIRDLHTLIEKMRSLFKSYTDISSYMEIMYLKPTILTSKNTKPLKKCIGKIEFQNVSFMYNSDKEIIHSLNFTINPKETVALVGPSGGGKTTITKLLLRFYDVSEGQIKIDGIDIKEIDPITLRKNIGLVPQEPILFNDTLAYNISYPKPGTDMETIIEASKKANLHTFIDSLHDKYNTVVGERGIKLSGGQKQRVAIARALIANTPIVIFDEATSQLDSENEKHIKDAFLTLKKDKTTIIIAHRLSTVMDADRVLVIEDGHLIEIGNHQDLLEKKGVYNKLWRLQTEGFIE